MVENNTFARGNDRNIIWKIKTNMFLFKCKLKHPTGGSITFAIETDMMQIYTVE